MKTPKKSAKGRASTRTAKKTTKEKKKSPGLKGGGRSKGKGRVAAKSAKKKNRVVTNAATGAAKNGHVVANVATGLELKKPVVTNGATLAAGAEKRRRNWDEVTPPTKRERERMNHIHAALCKARARENGVNPLPNAEKLAKELKVHPQTIYRTIADMQNDWGMPIEHVPKRHGYRYTEDVVSTPFCKLSEGEVLAVYLSHEMLSAFHKMPLKKKAQSAFRKIIEQTGQALSFDAAMVEEAFSITPSGHPAYYHPKHFEMCCRAVLRSEELVLDYTKMHGEGAHVPELRRVRPLHLTFHEFAWYLLCWDLKAEDHRCYMLTRMNSVKETGTAFVRPKKFDARKILRKNFAIFTSGEPEDVALEFSPKVARMVQERQWHKSQKFTMRPDGSVGMTMQVAITPDLVVWVAGYMEDCRILEPMALRKDVSKRQELASQGHWEGAWCEAAGAADDGESSLGDGCQLASLDEAEGGTEAVETVEAEATVAVVEAVAEVEAVVEEEAAAEVEAVAVAAVVDVGFKSATTEISRAVHFHNEANGTQPERSEDQRIQIEHRLGTWGGNELRVDF